MARITFRPETVEVLNALSEKLGISKEETANNAILVYRDMIFNEHQSGSRGLLDDIYDSSELGRQMKRQDRQREIEEEERDIEFHRTHKRPYTPIR